MGKFRRIVKEDYESDSQSELYSRHAEDMLEFVTNKLAQKALSSDDKKRIIELMKSYGKRMYFRGKQEAEKSLPFADDKELYDVKRN